MDTLSILQKISVDKLDFVVYKWDHGPTFHLTLKQKTEGILLQVEASNADFSLALGEVWQRYQRITGTGIPEFAGPLLEAPSRPEKPVFEQPAIDDEIPF